VRVGRFLSIDPLRQKFSSESNYVFAGNNPILNIDVEGKYKYPANKAAEFYKKYPRLTNYLINNVNSDVMGSKTIKTAMFKHSGGMLTDEEISKATTWNSGPFIDIKPSSELLGGYGHYDVVGAPDSNEKIQTISLSEELAMHLEHASDEYIAAAIYGVYITLTHETVHHGDYLDGMQTAGEPGIDFGLEVFLGTTKHVQNVHENGSTTEAEVLVPYIGYDHMQLEDCKELLKLKKDEGKTDIFPTIPSSVEPVYTPPTQEKTKESKSPSPPRKKK
jgi:hypothetical protein